MLLLADYLEVMEYQNGIFKKFHGRVDSFLYSPFRLTFFYFRVFFQSKRFIDIANRKSTALLLHAKGLLSNIESEKESLRGKDLSEEITKVEDLIKDSIEFRDFTDTTIAALRRSKLLQLNKTHSNVDQIVETLYNILRILKKLNKVKSIDTTQLAVDLSKHSMRSLVNIFHGR